jgi:hypothetical protein
VKPTPGNCVTLLEGFLKTGLVKFRPIWVINAKFLHLLAPWPIPKRWYNPILCNRYLEETVKETLIMDNMEMTGNVTVIKVWTKVRFPCL